MSRESAGNEYALASTVWILFSALVILTLAVVASLFILLRLAADPAQLTTIVFLGIVAAGGAAGGLIHSLNSFVTYVGNGKLKHRWVPQYVMRPLLGLILALAITMLIKGDLLKTQEPAENGDGASLYSLKGCYFYGAIAVLVGMFVDLTIQKMQDIAFAIFGKPEAKADHFAEGAVKAPSAALNPDSQRIIAKCEEVFEANQSDCNKFVKAVAQGLGIQEIPADADADAILNFLKDASGWSKLTPGDDGAAKAAADQGQFVIGGLASGDLREDHGHVVVVVAGPLDPAHHRYPSAYWGKLGGVGARDKTINYAFKAPQRDNVRYFKRALPAN